MDKQELFRYFMENYYPRQEIVYRLPTSMPIAVFWPEMLAHRRERAVKLPLRAVSGEPFWYVPTDKLMRSGDALAHAVRCESAGFPPRSRPVPAAASRPAAPTHRLSSFRTAILSFMQLYRINPNHASICFPRLPNLRFLLYFLKRR